MLQQHIGKAPGGGAKVKANPPFRFQAEMGQGMGKLKPPAGYPGVILTADFKRRAISQQIARLFHPFAIGEDLATQDQRLRSGAAFRKASGDKQEIGALFWWAGHVFCIPCGSCFVK
jgi:hypothetical protein